MLDPNRVLLSETLKRTFNYYLTIINNRGEEKEFIYKKNKKAFLRELGNLSIRVILVEDYPSREDWQTGIFYLSKSGKSLYYKEKEGKQIEF